LPNGDNAIRFCPISGKKVAFCRHLVHYRGVPVEDDLVAHLVRSTPLSPNEAARVVAEVVAYYGELVPDYVRRRHAELKHDGLTNDLIFDEIAAELARRRFAAPNLSARQLRRLVYG
jgi:hypothetical protein